MEIYLVGGAVRDELLGRPIRERDWVVVGATTQRMLDLGYRQVGKDFPVFLHPQSKDEYALARTERKSGPGHKGFVTHAEADVSLEDDLRRRDLTINAIAKAADGTLIDPWGGQVDLAKRVLRHVSDAFVEDPLRVFRVARFAALLPDFVVAAETRALLRSMCTAGALAELPAERVWNEMERALSGAAPARFFEVLADCGGLDHWFTELRTHVGGVDRLFGELTDPLDRFGVIGKLLSADSAARLCGRLKAPSDAARLIEQVARHGAMLTQWSSLSPGAVYEVAHACGGLRQPEWFERVGRVVGTDVGPVVRAITSVTSAAFIERGLEGKALGAALDAARIAAIAAMLTARS